MLFLAVIVFAHSVIDFILAVFKIKISQARGNTSIGQMIGPDSAIGAGLNPARQTAGKRMATRPKRMNLWVDRDLAAL